jgi:glutamyl-tRNA synthetase
MKFCFLIVASWVESVIFVSWAMLRLLRPRAQLWSPSRIPYRPLTQVANSVDTPVRVRFAPSPTGNLHLGGLRTALLNYLLARKTKGTMILRIEDTDRVSEKRVTPYLGLANDCVAKHESILRVQNRLVPGSVDMLINALSWAGIEYEEGPGKGGPHSPYFQSERTELYRSHANQLLQVNATCTIILILEDTTNLNHWICV